MNQLLIALNKPQNVDKKFFFVDRNNANMILPALRSEHFQKCEITVQAQIPKADLKFLMNISRLLTSQAVLQLKGKKQVTSPLIKIIKNIGLHEWESTQESVSFGKKMQMNGKHEQEKVKLSIGYQNYEQEEIDEDDLMKNENINLSKKTQASSCADKPRACSNCTCGRKKDQPLPSKEELVNSVNEGKPVSGCGKCFLGDSFRCGTCPYAGLPAFKPGDKLKLVDQSNVVVEQSKAVVSGGRVKIEL